MSHVDVRMDQNARERHIRGVNMKQTHTRTCTRTLERLLFPKCNLHGMLYTAGQEEQVSSMHRLLE